MRLWIISSNLERFKSLILLWIDIWYIYLLFPEQIFQQFIQVYLLRIYGNDSACICMVLKVQVPVLFKVEITVPSRVI